MPYGGIFGSGIDILTGTTKGRVFDNAACMGFCRNIYDPNMNTTFRLPYNVENFRYKIQASDDINSESYDSLQSYTQAQLHGVTSSSSSSSGFNVFIAKASWGSNDGDTSVYQQIHTAASKTASSIYKVSTTVTVGEFLHKSTDQLLDPYFKATIDSLSINGTDQLGAYYNMFAEYGTHFSARGTLGAVYEQYYVVSQVFQQQSDSSASQMQQCFKQHFSASLFYVADFAEQGYDCKDIFSATTSSTTTNEKQISLIVNIRGGTVSKAAVLVAAKMNANDSQTDGTPMTAWIDSIIANPTIISGDYQPICELLLTAKEVQNTVFILIVGSS